MCIIAVSRKGIRQPSLDELRNMYTNNPDGAGYMFAREGKVHIHKGFMTWDDFERQIKREAFTENDSVVYHFRISTQAGICPTMTHPFPLTESLSQCEALDVDCPIGVSHNGIIHMTSFKKETRFSDTAYFIVWYLTKLVRNRADIADPCVNDMIETLTNSKWAIMDGKSGEIETVGKFKDLDGILFSNDSYEKRSWVTPTYTKYLDSKYWDDMWDSEYGYSYTGAPWHTTKTPAKAGSTAKKTPAKAGAKGKR